MSKRAKSIIASLLVVLAVVASTIVTPEVTIAPSGILSVSNIPSLVLAAEDPIRQPWGGTTVTEESWGYLYTLENGDIVQVGDITTEDFRAHIKTIRWNGVADFSMWLGDGSFAPTLVGSTVSFDFNSDISVEIYPALLSERLPEGGVEYDIRLKKKPAKSSITFNVDWSNITWTKLLPLDEEYDQVSAGAEWGVDLAPFSINATHVISDNTSEVLKVRKAYEVNSYVGEVTQSWHTTSDIGNGVTYSNVSRSRVHIHRGRMTDAEDFSAWVVDINLDETKKEITFDLPKTWLRAATYPVTRSCGVDPAYTEDMDFWVSDTYSDSDNTWSDYDLFTNKGVPKGAVAEIILTNLKANTEEYLGVRTDGSGLERRVQLHEAESGGVTTCRMFVLCDASTGLIETYCADVTDDQVFYLVGYWENVGFTERWDEEGTWQNGIWDELVTSAGSGAANRVCHFVMENSYEGGELTAGVRATDSSLNRYVVIHETEGGGRHALDIMAKADSNYKLDFYTSDYFSTYMMNAGYFGSELDFVEKFQSITNDGDGDWDALDLSTYLDQDGRVCDFLLTHNVISAEQTLGVRDGDDSSTNRYFLEHEAEDDGTSTGELAGFGISAKSNSSGVVNLYSSTTSEVFYLMGYLKPVACSPDISNTPSSYDFGLVAESSKYATGSNYFSVTNSSSGNITITIQGTDMTGGTSWTLSNTATPGADTYGLLFMSSTNSSANTTFEKSETDLQAGTVYGSTWVGQTYNSTVSHFITGAEVKVRKSGAGADPGICTLSIRDTNTSDKPTGSDLVYGTRNATTFDPSTRLWEYFEFNKAFYIESDTLYAIVIKVPDGSSPSHTVPISENFTVTGGPYSRGTKVVSLDSGSSWALAGNLDVTFRIYGDVEYASVIKKNSPYNNLIEAMLDSTTEYWGIQLSAPTSYSDGAEKEATITLTATCD